MELLAGKDALEGVSDAWQQLSLEQLPVVLLLHLKCFQLDPEGHTAKIVKNIDFPIDLKLDQSEWLAFCIFVIEVCLGYIWRWNGVQYYLGLPDIVWK